ncbi:MAG: histidine phosphatase family protein [Nanoarchaeota archaeon]
MPQNKHSKETFNNPAVIKPINIILVRHGESLANAQDISQGNNDEYSDTPLSKKGKEQAIKVAERLKKEPLDLIYSSDLKRAKETAEIINTFHHVPITSDKRLRDMLNDEPLEDFIKKCEHSLKDIEKEKKNTLVVAHGSSILTLLAITTGSREEGGKLVKEHSNTYGNTHVSVVEKKGNAYEIKLIGCGRHLS